MEKKILPLEEIREIVLGYTLDYAGRYNCSLFKALMDCGHALYYWIISGESDLSKFPTKPELQAKLVELVKTGKTEFTRIVQFYIGDYWRGTDVSKYPKPTKEDMESLLQEIEADSEEMRRLEAATEQARALLRHSRIDFEQMGLIFDYVDYMRRTRPSASESFLFLNVFTLGYIEGKREERRRKAARLERMEREEKGATA